VIRKEAHRMNQSSTRAACGVLTFAVLAFAPFGAFARDPGINQPGAAGNVVAPAARAATPGVGAPGVGVRDPGINQPGAAGNVGAPVARAATVGVGAPGVGVVDPGLNQPGVAGNVGGVARRSVRY
jgi:hypothetical protein